PAPRCLVPPGTPFRAGFTDLQAWIRNENLAPDWLRVGTDIVGGNPVPTFNSAFSLSGTIIPEPAGVMILGVAELALRRSRARMNKSPGSRKKKNGEKKNGD